MSSEEARPDLWLMGWMGLVASRTTWNAIYLLDRPTILAGGRDRETRRPERQTEAREQLPFYMCGIAAQLLCVCGCQNTFIRMVVDYIYLHQERMHHVAAAAGLQHAANIEYSSIFDVCCSTQNSF